MDTERIRYWICEARWHYVQLKRNNAEGRLRYLFGHVRDRFVVPRLGNDRTAYFIGLYGSGRLYLFQTLMQCIGKRSKYLRDGVRFIKGSSSMIYVGHATIKYPSRAQASPAVTRRILQEVKSRCADLIFVYRHPLDSLLSNWVWWRNYIRQGWMLAGISEAHKNSDDLCAELDKNFSDFAAFAEGDPDFFAGAIGPRFLSFREYVEETELFLPAASLSLRFEDFAIDPYREFTKIAQTLSFQPDRERLHLVPPAAKPYRYLTVKEKVPRFREFVAGLDADTRGRIERIGYEL
jgi:hypothetical protein